MKIEKDRADIFSACGMGLNLGRPMALMKRKTTGLGKLAEIMASVSVNSLPRSLQRMSGRDPVTPISQAALKTTRETCAKCSARLVRAKPRRAWSGAIAKQLLDHSV